MNILLRRELLNFLLIMSPRKIIVINNRQICTIFKISNKNTADNDCGVLNQDFEIVTKR